MRFNPLFACAFISAGFGGSACNKQPIVPTHRDSQTEKDAGTGSPAQPNVPNSSGNLKQIYVAMSKHAAAKGWTPASSVVVPPNTKPELGLSWRVHLLPYLDQDELFKKFKLDEPWDSATNKSLIGLMPKVYTSPAASANPGYTYYQVFAGSQTAFPPGGLRAMEFGNVVYAFSDATDGTANTIMTIEAGDPVIWTKPDDLIYDPKKPLPKLTLRDNPQVLICLCDGTVLTIDTSRLPEKTLRTAIVRNDGEALAAEWAAAVIRNFTREEMVAKQPQPPPSGPLKLEVSTTYDLGRDEAKAMELDPQPGPQTLTVEFSSSRNAVSVYIFKKADIKGFEGLLTANPKLALAATTGQAGKLVAAVPEKTAISIVFREVNAPTSIAVKVTNQK
ncbi:MAG: hypothetical protein C0467_13630 [Planctomycetaceae bacterium]|nr:hypothetical protein [Planctomycetaceae bacterium]